MVWFSSATGTAHTSSTVSSSHVSRKKIKPFLMLLLNTQFLMWSDQELNYEWYACDVNKTVSGVGTQTQKQLKSCVLGCVCVNQVFAIDVQRIVLTGDRRLISYAVMLKKFVIPWRPTWRKQIKSSEIIIKADLPVDPDNLPMRCRELIVLTAEKVLSKKS